MPNYIIYDLYNLIYGFTKTSIFVMLITFAYLQANADCNLSQNEIDNMEFGVHDSPSYKDKQVLAVKWPDGKSDNLLFPKDTKKEVLHDWFQERCHAYKRKTR